MAQKLVDKTLQLNVDATYRQVFKNSTQLQESLPILATSVYAYPGKQELIGIGYEYKYGYDNSGKFQLIQLSSLKLAWKI